MASPRKNIGIIGVGFGAQVHVPAFRSEGWDVVAICSRNRDKAQKAADEAGIAGVYTDPMELIRRDDLDAIAIITPPGAHHAACDRGAQRGQARSLREAFRPRREAGRARCSPRLTKSGRTAMIAHEFRHTPQRAYIRQLLADGYIGKFQLCTMELFLDRYVTREPRAAHLERVQVRRRRTARRARVALHRWLAILVRRDRFGERLARRAFARTWSTPRRAKSSRPKPTIRFRSW